MEQTIKESLPPEPVEVSPETEQQKETIADCGKKTLMDNPSLADNIGSHMNLAFDYAKKLVNENTRLRAQLYRLPMLEQENAELKAQLAAKNELLSNTEQLPVYDTEWLANAVNNYDDIYRLIGVNINVGGITMSANNSAHIILRAVAKELNGDWVADWEDNEQKKWRIENGYTAYGYAIRASAFSCQNFRGITLFKDEETTLQAIDILTTHFPEVLKNYFL